MEGSFRKSERRRATQPKNRGSQSSFGERATIDPIEAIEALTDFISALSTGGGSAGSAGSGTATLSDGVGSPPQVGRMRRRFHELLDDAFSLFAGSRSASRSASQASQDDDESTTSSPPPPGPPAAGLQLSSVLDHVLPGPPPDHRVQSAVQRYGAHCVALRALAALTAVSYRD